MVLESNSNGVKKKWLGLFTMPVEPRGGHCDESMELSDKNEENCRIQIPP
jgi:hypothetical protein